jgi:hypothetical protein
MAHMSISTYFRPNIHQNGPEILEVKLVAAHIFNLPKVVYFTN